MSLQNRLKLVVSTFMLFASGFSCAENLPAESDRAVFVRYTEYGIPHIRERDYESVGFGQGYAQARDNLCEIERGMLALTGQLSRHFGPDALGSTLSAASERGLDSDLYFAGLVARKVVERLVAQAPPLGPRDEVRQLVRGYVAGFNQLLAEGGSYECNGAPWLRAMTELDVYRRAYAITTLMDQSGIFAGGIISAEPPVESSPPTHESPQSAQYDGLPRSLPGSNAVALGSQMTAHGGGINLANPHLDWHGDMRWYLNHLAIPDGMDVSGATVIGMPLVVMGHTRTVAWSITTAEKTRHSTVYDLTLASDSPTTYLVDGVREPMEAVEVQVQVKRDDGSLETVTRTQWWTRYGAVLGPALVLPLPAWTASRGDEPGHAFAIADANAGNMRMLNTLFAFNHAQTTDDILEALRETQGAPWWTVVAADARGETLWSQIQVVPNVSDAMLERCSTEYGRGLFAAAGFVVLDGSRTDCAWENSPDALQPGTFGPGDELQPQLPFAVGDAYFENSNDSHWLPSATLKISGMPRIVGDEGTPRSLRTRGLIAELEAQRGKASYTRRRVEDTMLSNRSYAAELALEATIALCRSLEGRAVSTDGKPVDVRDACDVLANWNGRADKESRGALLFSRYWTFATEATAEDGSLWTVAFDPEDPVHTPNTLAVSNPLIAQALADAVLELERADIAIDAALGEHQFIVRNGEHIPLGGGTDELGVVNLVHASFTAEGFTMPFKGSTYMHVVELGASCPDAGMLLTYSQSSEPSSAHHRDQTQLYSDKRWVDARFCEADILRSPALEIIEVPRVR